MSRAAALLAGAFLTAACSTEARETTDPGKAPAALRISVATVEKRPLARFLRVTGCLMADEQAEVSAETAGRVIATPVERGTRVTHGAALDRISPSETSAQLAEAEANAGFSQVPAMDAMQQSAER